VLERDATHIKIRLRRLVYKISSVSAILHKPGWVHLKFAKP